MWLARLISTPRSAVFSYATIFLLQLKIMWGAWLYRDLTSGDTSSYFVNALSWYRNWQAAITWSPLYTSFYGTLLYLSRDAYVVTTLHRLIIVLALAILVLALMRRLLPPGVAWLVTVWWVVLPIDFNSLYEVHLFALIPVLLAFIAALSTPGPWGRGWALGILLASVALVRNELLLAVVLFGGACLGWEIAISKRGGRHAEGLLRPYGLPLLSAVLLIGFFYFRANDHATLADMMSRKHSVNVCQVYAFGYQQRASDWQGSPWTECQQLMARDYGLPTPSLWEALRRNPRAMLTHFWWNARLIPSGIQVLLFNSRSGAINPDYAPTTTSGFVFPASLAACGIFGAGLFLLVRERGYWWKAWLRDRIWAWIAMGCVACVVVVTMVTQRPRPSYMFALGIFLRAAVGLCTFVCGSRWPRLQPPPQVVAVVMILTVVLIPPYFRPENASRPLLDSYRRLAPFQYLLERPGATLVSLGFGGELCGYFALSRCRTFQFAELNRQLADGAPLPQLLNKVGATVFLADENLLADTTVDRFVSSSSAYGWQTVSMQRDNVHRWAVLKRGVDPGSLESAHEIATPGGQITLGAGWHPLEAFNGEYFRWVENDAEIELQSMEPGPEALYLTLEAGPSLNGKPFRLQVFDARRLLQTAEIPNRRTLRINLPRHCKGLRLHTTSDNKPIPGDPRILNFRVLKIWTQ